MGDDQGDLDPAASGGRQRGQRAFVRDEVGRRQDDLLPRQVDGCLQDLDQRVVDRVRTGPHHLDGDAVLARGRDAQQIREALVRVEVPILDEQLLEVGDRGTLEAQHRVDPRRVLGFGREGRVRQVLGAGVADVVIDHRDLAVVAQVHACGEQGQERRLERGDDLGAGFTQGSGQARFQERARAQRVDQDAASDAPFGGAQHGFGHALAGVVRQPDVEQQVDVVRGAVDVLDQSLDGLAGVGEQVDLVARTRVRLTDGVPEFRQRAERVVQRDTLAGGERCDQCSPDLLLNASVAGDA